MRVLITGVTGFVGSHLVDHLLAQGDVVAGLSNSTAWPPGREDLARQVRLERCDLYAISHDELTELLVRKQPEAIYHLAAQSNPQRSVSEPRETWATNLMGTLNLLEAIRASGLKPRTLLISSGVCYGNPPPEHVPVTELCPLAPNNPYAASKAAADLLGVQHWLAHRTPTVMARPFNHAGPGQADLYALSSFARQIAEVESGARDCLLVGNLDVVRDFTDVRDIVRAYRLLVVEGAGGEIYNIGTGRPTPLARLLEILCELARVPVEVRIDPTRLRPVDQPLLLADASKLRAATGWEPEYDERQTLNDMLEYWRGQLAAPK